MRTPREQASTPGRMPVACGAVGRFERATVDAIAGALPGRMTVAVERDGVILMTDRPPRTWETGSVQGWSWGRALPPAGPAPTSWQGAAERGDLGLVVGPGGAQIHSTTNGAMSLFWLGHEGAIYFASKVDPLALHAPGSLTTDWDTWASILMFGTPGGPHTPFQEIHRMAPQAVAMLENGRAVERAEEWPWLQIEPTVSIARGAGPVLEAMRAIVARIPDRPMPHALSGGLDSRLIAVLMAERGLDATAYTVNGDSGNDREEQAAAAVADALGFEHRTLTGRPQDFWREAEERALWVDFLRHANPWLSPAFAAVSAAASGTVLDGLAGQNLLDGGEYLVPSMLGPDQGDLAGAFWRAARKERAEPLAGEFGTFCVQRSRRRLRATARFLQGHPNRGLLMPYWLRSMNGVSHVAYGHLGAQADVECPFVSHEVAMPALAVSLTEKAGASLRAAVTDLVNPRVALIPNNHERFPTSARLPIRRKSEEVLRGFREVLAEGPLAPWISDDVWDGVSGGERRSKVKPRRLYRSTLGVVNYHLWVRRYGSRVRGTDPAEALGIAPP